MKNWGCCKYRYSLNRLKRSIIPIIYGVFGILGFFLSLCEGVDEIFGYKYLFEFYKQNFLFVLAISSIFMICIKWDKLSISVPVRGAPDISITIKVCDALNNEGAVVIPTNTTFDTLMDDDFISDSSLQGQYQNRYYKNCLSHLDSLLKIGLEGKQYTKLNDGRKTNDKRYSIGTVSRVSILNKRAYFLAVADINKKGISITPDASDIHTALIRLWDELNKEGNRETYSVPLIGTGRAGVKNITRNEIIKEIILTFLLSTQNYKLTEHLIICVHPSDYPKIDWDEICDYLKYNSKYFYDQRKQLNKSNAEGKLESMEETNKASVAFSSKEKQVIQLLTNNQLSKEEISSSMGISLIATTMLIVDLKNKNAIKEIGGNGTKRYTMAENKLVNSNH